MKDYSVSPKSWDSEIGKYNLTFNSLKLKNITARNQRRDSGVNNVMNKHIKRLRSTVRYNQIIGYVSWWSWNIKLYIKLEY